MRFKALHITIIALGFLGLIGLVSLQYFSESKTNKENKIEKFWNEINNIDLECESNTNQFNQLFSDRENFRKNISKFFQNHSNPNCSFFLFQDSSLLLWSKNDFIIFEDFTENNFQPGINNLSNGWYYLFETTNENFQFLQFYLIKRNYPYENKYLKNAFSPQFSFLDKHTKILFDHGTSQQNITLEIPESKTDLSLYQMWANILLFFTLISFLITLGFAYNQLNRFIKSRYLRTFFFVVDIILLRLILSIIPLPTLISRSQLFEPFLYASSKLNPSLGHLLINLIFLFPIALTIFNTLKVNKPVKINRSPVLKLLLKIVTLTLAILLTESFSLFIEDLVLNSSFKLDLNTITAITGYSILAYLSLLIFGGSLLLIISPLIQRYIIFFSSIIDVVLFSSITTGIYQIFKYWVVGTFSPYLLFVPVFVISFWYINKRNKTQFEFSHSLFYIVTFSMLFTHLLHKNISFKEKQDRSIWAAEITQKENPLAEYRFKDTYRKIMNDNIIRQKINDSTLFIDDLDLELSDYLYNKYFENNWQNMDILLTNCFPNKDLNIQPESIITPCNTYFQTIIDTYGKPTDIENLYFISYENQSENYLGIIQLEGLIDTITVYVELYSQTTPSDLGYPELLRQSEKNKFQLNTSYSIARYHNEELIYRYGKFYYSSDLNYYQNEKVEEGFFYKDKYSHFIFKPDSYTTIIISKQKPSFLELAAPFSYIIILFGIVFLVYNTLTNKNPLHEIRNPGFKIRLQLSITALLVISFLFVGIGSLLYISSLNDQKNYTILSEKAHSVLIEIEHKLATEQELTYDMQPYLNDLLYKFSLVFFTDINLFDLNGNLLATSRPEVVDKGLLSNKMNPTAFHALNLNQMSLFTQKETIGDYSYLSTYLPFRNIDNNLIAYLNLPYFARQDELTKEISTFLVAFINIYVMLIAVAIFTVLLISNYISKPLQLLKEKMSKISYKGKSEKIEWNKNDEVGSLVQEYNRMVDELAISANLLAKSERESAWREMAKQIAHEIKNPLTPMKLNVQYLKKAWDENAPDWELRLKNFTNTLTEQIDSLSVIAGEFSDFAKIPRSTFTELNIVELINSSISLFKNTIRFETNLNSEMNLHILADKDQMLRVFNNLFKNAIQAIRDQKSGVIKISVRTDNNTITIEIEDNGVGIPEEEKENIFEPNFTTKSSGMGLGLAMVKNIITNTKGEISFVSEVGIGTTFIIELPRYYNK